jgi:transketolase
LNFIDVATGSLGQGLSLAAGLAFAGKHVDKSSYRTYCLLGDGETAEGAVWEAAAFSSHYGLDNLLAIIDINRLGQSRETALGHDVATYAKRFEAFGWHTIQVDGHNVEQLLKAYAEAKSDIAKGKPTVILAKTFKGHGIEDVANAENYHGKALPKEKADLLRKKLKNDKPQKWNIPKPVYDTPNVDLHIGSNKVREFFN